MNITLQKIERDAPNKFILVDGEIWARTECDHRGLHGKRYFIDQIVGKAPSRAWVKVDTGSRGERAYVWGKTKLVRNDGIAGNTTDERIINYARRLIKSGKLVSPALAQWRADKEREAREAAAEAAGRKKEATFHRRAREALGWENEQLDEAQGATLYRVVEAMKWAQSQ